MSDKLAEDGKPWCRVCNGSRKVHTQLYDQYDETKRKGRLVRSMTWFECPSCSSLAARHADAVSFLHWLKAQESHFAFDVGDVVESVLNVLGGEEPLELCSAKWERS